MKIALLLLLASSAYATATSRRNLDPYAEAEKLRQAIEVPPVAGLALNPVQFPAESYQLDVNPVFNQGATQFCWAYAALHTLRTFYGKSVHASDEPRKKFLNGFADTAAYKAWVLKKVGSLSEPGWPIEAVYFYDQSLHSLPSQPWVSLVPSTTQSGWYPHPPPDLHSYTPQSYYTTIDAISEQIRKGLAKGAPASFCTVTHCTAIYGATYDGGVAKTYLIADSAGGHVYTAAAVSLHARIADIMALAIDVQ